MSVHHMHTATPKGQKVSNPLELELRQCELPGGGGGYEELNHRVATRAAVP